MNEQLDPTVVNMARAIKMTETRNHPDPYKARGASGEYGAYQYTDKTWSGDAQKYLGQDVPLESATIEQQNKVAYHKIKELKDSGLNPAQVASKWNSGDSDAYNGTFTYDTPTHKKGDPSFGKTPSGVRYDVPGYAKSVSSAYEQLKTGQYPNYQDTASTVDKNGTQNPEDTQDPSLGTKLHGRLEDASSALTKGLSGQINPISGVLQAVGQGAGAVGDIVNKGIELIPGVKYAEGLLGKGVGKLAQTGIGKSIMGSWDSFAQAHPEAAGDISAIGNIATLVPIFKGFGLAKEAVGGALAKALGKDVLSSAIEDVAPKETASALAKGVAKRGTKKSLLTGRITPVVDAGVKDIAEAYAKNVPGISKAKDLATKINLTQDTVSAMAEDLKNQVIKSGSDKIYSFRELESEMNKIPEPLGIVKDQKAILQRVKKAALDIAKKNGGKISNLFDARKEFDALIRQQFPNLYSSDTLTPIRIAVRSIRNSMTDFTAKNLPDVALKDSLKLQSKLIEAIENMSEKVSSGVDKEIGTTRFQRFGKKHPVVSGLISKGGKVALTGAGTALGFDIGKHLLGE